MKQVFVDQPLSLGNIVDLEEATAHHIFDVLRTRGHERIRVIDSDHHLFFGRTLEKPRIEILEQIEEAEENPIELTLCAALIKVDKFEWMLQKATELGVTRIVPFTSENTVVSIDSKKLARKMERWNSICMGACRQSNRTRLVRIEEPCTLKDLPKYLSGLNLCAWEKKGPDHMLAALLPAIADSATFVIGPEGGLSQGEAQYLEEHGFSLCSLGSRILRAETAACYVLSAADYQLSLDHLKLYE